MMQQVDLQLNLPSEVKLNSSMGSIFHGVLMEIVGQDTAAWLHEQQQNRPFNQCVFYDKELKKSLWRITTLTEEAGYKIMQPVIASLGKEFFLKQKGYSFCLDSLVAEKTQSYQDLADKIFLDEGIPLGGNIKFLTAASFKRDGEYLVMPELYLIFQSLLNKWNTFSPQNKLLEKDLEYTLAKCSKITKYSLHSQPFSLERSVITGFKGEIQLKFRANEMIRRIIALLLSYAQFAGVGIKTALGMGGLEANYTSSKTKNTAASHED